MDVGWSRGRDCLSAKRRRQRPALAWQTRRRMHIMYNRNEIFRYILIRVYKLITLIRAARYAFTWDLHYTLAITVIISRILILQSFCQPDIESCHLVRFFDPLYSLWPSLVSLRLRTIKVDPPGWTFKLCALNLESTLLDCPSKSYAFQSAFAGRSKYCASS